MYEHVLIGGGFQPGFLLVLNSVKHQREGHTGEEPAGRREQQAGLDHGPLKAPFTESMTKLAGEGRPPVVPRPWKSAANMPFHE